MPDRKLKRRKPGLRKKGTKGVPGLWIIKTLRQNGDTTFKIAVTFDRCEIADMKEGIFRSDSSASTARITNSRLHNAGDICIGSWRSCTSSGITYY